MPLQAQRDDEKARRRMNPRSWLFVPADSEKKLTKSLQSGADAVIFDLEDAVGIHNKDTARACLANFLRSALAQPSRPQIYVRVNALATGLTLADLAQVLPHHPDGIVLPKCESGQDLALLGHYLDVFDHLHHPARPTSIVAIVTETARSLFALGDYAAHPRLRGLMWGAEDLASDVGASRNRDPDTGHGSAPFELARSLCLFAAAAARVDAIDTVYTDYRDSATLQRQASRAHQDGFASKAAIHPAQIEVIHQAMCYSAEQRQWAQQVVQAFAKHTGVATLDGRMLDLPHLRQAERILSRSA